MAKRQRPFRHFVSRDGVSTGRSIHHSKQSMLQPSRAWDIPSNTIYVAHYTLKVWEKMPWTSAS
jgi:hypothetical protein